MNIETGNTACAKMAYKLSDISFIYPITPSSPMASEMDLLSNLDKRNVFDDTVNVVQMQSEGGAAGALHGALITGSLASTFTSSQGLLLMIPNMYKMAGELLPGVIHVASRSIATHALSIFGDHQDIYACRQTGFAILASTNVQDAYNLGLVSHLSAMDSSVPFLHFFDGFRTSHEVNMIKEIPDEEIKKMVNFDKIAEFRKRALNSGKSITKGTAQNEDVYFQMMEGKNKIYEGAADVVNANMQKVNALLKTDYKPFNYYGSSSAEHVIVAMGSVCDTIKNVIKENNKYGLVEVHLYRPFSKRYFEQVLPKTVKNIAVLDRTKEHGSTGEPLYLDVLSILSDTNIKVYGGRYGLSSKNTTPSDIYDVFMMLENSPKNNFTIGIVDDVTKTSLKKYNYDFKNGFKEIKIYGFGSDGLVSASRDILDILSSDNFVQGYSEYDSKKSGSVTINHLRFSDSIIKAPYYTTAPELIAVSKDEYFQKYDMISNIEENGILLINTPKTEKELNDFLPSNVKKTINDKKVSVYTIDADKIAMDNNLGGRISLVMEANIFQLMKYEGYEDILIKSVERRFKTKGKDIVNANINCIRSSKSNLNKVTINNVKTFNLIRNNNIVDKVNVREGDHLKVSEVVPFTDGILMGGTAALEKRKLTRNVPKWDPEKCIECGICSILCPHAVVRQFIVNEGGKYTDIAKKSMEKGKDFIISVSEADCTACGICLKECPRDCFEWGVYDEKKQEMADDLFNNHINPKYPDVTIRDTQFKQPLFEFSGACAGCGETPYLKLLTQLVGRKLVIANATGCSSIYGASFPSSPYKVSWANSLFEDNAEFGLGMLETYDKMHERIDKILKDNIEAKDFYQKWLDNKNDYDAIKELEKDANKYLPLDLIEYLTPKSVWTIGGDGWAYDIGFGGIDHVLSSGKNAKILVLDTEVYSNTGGQASKASKMGAVAEFANMGKKTYKKDLFKIAMTYPNVYVAEVSMGANIMQTVKALKEAEAHDGPAIILAYSPCVEHGIKGGLVNSVDQQKLGVESGYSILMRYKDNKLYIDSREPNFEKYEEYLKNEIRYSALEIKDKKIADELLKLNKSYAINRYNYYKNLAE